METTLNIKRLNPEALDPKSYSQEYTIDVPEHYTVLDALIQIREDLDGSLALRCSCRASICGSCSMRINGQASLACKTKLITLPADGRYVTVGPMGNMPVIKDLIVDMAPFWNKIKAVDPYLTPADPDPVMAERRSPNEAMVHLAGVMNCIMCGACVSDCTALEVDSSFLGPAALAKAYRFVGDPRDGASKERLEKLNEKSGVWDCTRCMFCVEVCPKDVNPMGRIMALRESVISAGHDNTTGARHTIAFGDLVKKHGRLDELRLTVRTFGIFNVKAMLGLMPVGFRALIRGKMPPLLPHSIPGVEGVRRIFQKVEAKK